jgi:transcriptional antiterminator RfaH
MSEGGMDGMMDGVPLLDWYVVATKPQSEALASRSIARLGFQCYAPTMPVTLRCARKGTETVVQKPTFPHYLFVPFDAVRDPWPRIASAFGVSRILTTGAPSWSPLRLPKGFVERLMMAMPDSAARPNVVMFQVGDEVTVQGGPFDGVMARIATLDRRGRCSLLLRILGGEIKAQFEVAQIARRRSA